MKTEYIVGIGELLWDVLPDGRRLGGAPANFAYHVSQFGLKSVVVSAVGRDEAGDAAVRELEAMSTHPFPDSESDRSDGSWYSAESGLPEKSGLPVKSVSSWLVSGGFYTLIDKVDSPTGTVDIRLDAAGVPQYNIRMPVAWDSISWTPALRQLASRTRAVCFGTLSRRSPVSRRTISEFVDAVPRVEGYWRILDINLRQQFYGRDIVLHALSQCNVLKINDEELAVLSGMLSLSGDDILSLCRDIMQRYGLKILILTCGVRGSYVFSSIGRDVSFIGTPKVVVADTVGAGDSFTAAFTSALIRGLPIPDAHRLAVNVSAYVCTCQGAMPPLPEDLRSMRSGTEEVVMGLSEL